jgi:hypothetical protein
VPEDTSQHNYDITLKQLPARAASYVELVERVVAEVGEHPTFELKRSISLQSLGEKTEFVRDV